MTQAPYISIITPTFNHERFIGQCIESVLAQTYESWEQIVIDDGSTDQTAAIAERVGDPRVQVIRQANRGIDALAETYNLALERARGEVIAILEGDDLWPRTSLEDRVEPLISGDAVLSFGVTQIISSSGRPLDRFIPSSKIIDRYPDELFNRPIGAAAGLMAQPAVLTFTFPCSVLIRADALRAIGGFQQVPGLPFTDFPTFFELARSGAFWFVPRVTGYWRQLPGSGTRVRNPIATNQALVAFLRERITLVDLEDSWAAHASDLVFYRARHRALAGDWAGAFADFGRVALGRHSNLQTRLMGMSGVVCSAVHVDVEWVYRLVRGRDWDLRSIYDAVVDNVDAPISNDS